MTPYGILGHPLAHSLSPVIHSAAFEALGHDARYDAVDVEPDDLRSKIAELKAEGYAGFNVTIPHKEAILPLLDEVDPDARTLGAVNTVIRKNDGWVGTNTDMYGFLKCIEPVRDRVQNEEILLLGAGGAARAVLHGLLKEMSPKSVMILNRSLDRAEALAAEFGTRSGQTRLLAESLFQENLQNLVGKGSVIINATSVGMRPYVDATPLEEIKFKKDMLLVDLIYTPLETTLMKAVRHAGGTAVGGLEMLLQQASRSFALWTGKEMPMDTVRKKVEETLNAQIV